MAGGCTVRPDNAGALLLQLLLLLLLLLLLPPRISGNVSHMAHLPLLCVAASFSPRICHRRRHLEGEAEAQRIRRVGWQPLQLQGGAACPEMSYIQCAAA